jgi:hypothetical protein
MADFDLLDAVLAPDGWYAVVGIKNKKTRQHLVETREEVNELVQDMLEEERDVYFGCAKYETGDNRTGDNAKYFKALWVDIDCGEDKAASGEGYIDQATGLQELQRFCKTIGLPKPILINSGRGVHAYWALTEVIGRDRWQPMMDRLAELCKIHSLIADPKCFEPARILRVPNTLNFKDTPPSPVTVIATGGSLSEPAELRVTLGVTEKKFAPRRQIQRSALTLSLMGNRISRFKTIMMKSAQGEGCKQLVHCFQNQDTISYNLWRSALSITAFCEEGASAAHKMSEKYPGYDPEEVEIKVQDLQRKGGPHFCETFEKENPDGCSGCIHKGKITTPIVLGKEIAQAEKNEQGLYEVEAEEEEEVVSYKVPAFPYPYFRGKAGGIYMEKSDDDPVLIYEHDLYVLKRMTDPEMGEMALMRLHLPRDGVKEFAIAASALTGKDEPKKFLGQNGVLARGQQMDNIVGFLLSCAKDIQLTRKAELMRTQFGWADSDSKFIIGDREITADGVYYSPPSSHTEGIAQHMVAKGTLDKWKEVFNMYARPGLEANAFAALTAFGSPLLKFTGLKGAIINVIFPHSGSGKSTALFMANSVYGHPTNLVAIPKDTMNARMHMLGVMNNLPFTMDEITNMKPEEFSDLTYAMSQGRGKNRQEAGANKLRKNNTTWQNITLSSGNASFYEKLGSLKNTPDGEMMRLVEYTIGYSDAIPMEEGKQMFDHQLLENYGHAGDIYAQWLVGHKEEAVQQLKEVQAKIDKELRLSQRERFWSGVVACNIMGGLIAKSLGLHNYDMKAIYKWACSMIRDIREDSTAPRDDPSSVIGDFINRHIRNTLVVDGEADARTKLLPAPIQEPYGELIIRYEPDTKKMYIVAKSFKDDCVERQINYKDTMKELQTKGIYQGSTTRRMTSGTKIKGTPVHVMQFDCSAPEFINVDEYVGVEKADEGSGSSVSN